MAIRRNLDTDLFGAGINVSGGGNSAAFHVAPLLAAGDTIDFSVGFGNGLYGNDSTGLKMAASAAVAVPEASTLALALPALAMVGAVVVRRRKK